MAGNNNHIRNKIVSCKLYMLLNRLILLYFNHKGGHIFSEVVLAVHSLRTTGLDSRAAHIPAMFERNAQRSMIIRVLFA